MCKVLEKEGSTEVLLVRRRKNFYGIYTNDLDRDFEFCLFSMKDKCVTWHKRLRHANTKHLVKIANQKLVFELPKLICQKTCSIMRVL